LFSLSCVVAGSGILSLPYALSRSGWIGSLFLILNALISHYTGCLLIRLLYMAPKGGRLDGFPEIGHAAFGKTGQLVALLFSQLLLFGTPIVYFILASSNIRDLLQLVGWSLSFKLCTWIVSITVGVPFVMVRQMRDVTWMSLIATIASVLLLLIVTVAAADDYTGTAVHDVAIPRQLPLAMSTFSFSFCGNVIYPHLEGAMQQPEHWAKVMSVANITVAIMYTTIGFAGYFVYGTQVQNPIFLNLTNLVARNVAIVAVTVHVLLAAPLYLYVFTVRVEAWLLHVVRQTIVFFRYLGQHPVLARVLLRSLEICVCALIAMLFPYFSKVMTLIGTVAAEALMFVLPCVFRIKFSISTTHTQASPSRTPLLIAELVVCILISLFGLTCILFGTVDTITLLFS
ncbi:transmembrane amino acid transporter protein-domain-containing protein, partial [Gongronella butleri]